MRLLPLPGVFQPPGDAWMLAGYLRREGLAAGRRVLDVCTGSGVLAMAAALGGAAEVTAVDISRRSATAVKVNSRLNGVRIRSLRGDLFTPVRGRRFDLIVSNPPYLPGELAELPRRGLGRAVEGGPSGRVFIERIAAQAADHLTDNGILLLVFSSVCGEQQCLDALRAGGLSPTVVVRRRGPLGPWLSTRADWLRRNGLLLGRDEEELLLVLACSNDGGPVSAGG